MARALRIEYPNALYHVMNRGNRRERVFRRQTDYGLFLDRLGRFTEEFNVEVLAYCLMPNHFHVFLRTREANLSRFMQSLLTSYTVFVNRRDRASGHIFQGRFKAQVVESEGYFATLSRYIHLNPVRVRAVKALPIEERRRVLAEFRWSSFRSLTGQAVVPSWLKTDDVLREFGRAVREQMRAYRLYVEEGLIREVEDPAEAARVRSILGSDTFVEWIRREFLLCRVKGEDEQRELRRLQSGFSFEEVLAAAAMASGVRAAVLQTRRCRDGAARDLLAALARRYCRGTVRAAALARATGLTYSGFVHASERGRARAAAGDPAWAKAVKHLAHNGHQMSVQRQV
jgi:REP element-mobilizing transposase RayT